MQLTENNLNTLQQLDYKTNNIKHHNNKSIIYIAENYLYKIVDSSNYYPKEFERNIDFLIKNEIPNTPKILDKIYYNDIFYGYIMEYIKDGITFKEAILKTLTIEERIKAIIDIHKTLKVLHSHNIILGDIHLDDLIINKNGGYITNLDYIRYPEDKEKFITCYNIKENEVPSVYTDIVKTMIASLSLLIDMSLEDLIHSKNNCISLEYIYNMIIPATRNKKLKDYFKKIMDGESIYFDDFLIENNYYKEDQKTI